MDSQVEFLNCPAYVDDQGTVRCGLPAEVIDRFRLGSTDGWLAAAAIVCPRNHRFNGVVDSLLLKRVKPVLLPWLSSKERVEHVNGISARRPGAATKRRPRSAA